MYYKTMDQLTLNLQQPLNLQRHRKTLLVDTTATDLHKKLTTTLGITYTKEALNADICSWKDTIPNIKQYQTIGFSVNYLTNVLNIAPFLKKHDINPLKAKRTHDDPIIIVGGQGATNIPEATRFIADKLFLGESDGNAVDEKGWQRMTNITSKPVINYEYKMATIEIDRGCRYHCSFCEYGNLLGGQYREKNIQLLKDQITDCANQNIRRITLRSANLAGYSKMNELMELCNKCKIRQASANIAVINAPKILPWLETLKINAPKIGVESFDENTRINTCGSAKSFSDQQLEWTLEKLMQSCNLIHIYLIFGLPNDDYSKWMLWIKKIAAMRRKAKNKIRINFSITDLEPCANTPLANAKTIDYHEKSTFLKNWIEECKNAGLYKQSWDVKPGNDFGLLGRNQQVYKLIMALRKNDANSLTPKIINALPNGVRRSISTKQATAFLNY